MSAVATTYVSTVLPKKSLKPVVLSKEIDVPYVKWS